MGMSKKIVGVLLLIALGYWGWMVYVKSLPQPEPIPVPVPEPSPIPVPQPVDISVTTPSYCSYENIIKQLQQWEKEAPDLVDVGVYGKTSKGKEIYYIRLTDEKKVGDKKKVLTTGCIHGNEPHSTFSILAYVGNMLAGYAVNEEVTTLLATRELFFVPVVSPDSYPNRREVDGVDPNRDFITKQSAAVRALQTFMSVQHFNAVWSGHTYGRVFLTPWGEDMSPCPDDAAYQEIMGEVGKLCDYNVIRACEMYRFASEPDDSADKMAIGEIRYGEPGWDSGFTRPIYGGELDWFYKNGAFAVVCEYGTHQRAPSDAEIKSEFERTYKGYLYFVTEAPVVELKL
jgi:hypothetical protein